MNSGIVAYFYNGVNYYFEDGTDTYMLRSDSESNLLNIPSEIQKRVTSMFAEGGPIM